jgi:uncharacterized protein
VIPRRTAASALVVLATLMFAACGAGGGAPSFSAPVVDDANVVSRQVEDQLNAILEDFRIKVGPQIAVLTVESTGNKSLEDYGIDIAREWGIGDSQRDDGVLLLIVMNDRVLRIETGSGIEGDLTDVEAGRIIDSVVVPELRNNNPDGAVIAGVDALMTELSGETYAYPEESGATSGDTVAGATEVGPGQVIFAFVILAFFVIGILATVVRGRRRGLGALDILSILFIFTRAASGGGGGGFSGGGGGGFSGGGASGSW